MRRVRNGAGFTYPEMLVVITIVALVFFFTIPLYKRFNALNELKTTSQAIRDQLRAAQNKSSSGVAAANGQPAHWIVHLHRNSDEFEYEKAACPVVMDPAATGYSDRYNFNSCPNRSDYELFDFPSRFSITHQYTDQNEVNIFFSSINGTVKVYDATGGYLGNTVDIRISSDDYPDIYVILHVNASGNISEERMAN